MAAIQLGDRVQILNQPEMGAGTVVELSGTCILVGFDNWFKGHNGTRGQLKNNNGWYYTADRLIPDAATAENWDFDPREKLASFVIAIDTSEAIDNVDRLLAKLQEIETLTKRLGIKLAA